MPRINYAPHSVTGVDIELLRYTVDKALTSKLSAPTENVSDWVTTAYGLDFSNARAVRSITLHDMTNLPLVTIYMNPDQTVQSFNLRDDLSHGTKNDIAGAVRSWDRYLHGHYFGENARDEG